MRHETELLGGGQTLIALGQNAHVAAEQPELPGEARHILPQGQIANASARQPDGDEEGHPQNAQARSALPSSSPTTIQELLSEGHADRALGGHATPAPAEQPDISETVAAIRYWHRQRNYAMDQRKRADLALGSFLRSQLGWAPDKTPAERKVISDQAAALVALGEAEAKGKGKPVETDEPVYVEWRDVIAASIAARYPFDAIEKRATKEMERLAKTLPVWLSFGVSVRGFGARSLAVIVGEAGDLSDYASHSKLWKRMGVAVMDGKRQGGLSKSASKDDWIAHGYNRKRRSHLFVIGDAMVKVGDYYRAVYLARKEYERARAVASGMTVAPAAKIPKSRAAEFMSDGHVHRRAQRYMEKRLLRNLWRAWRVDRSARNNEPDKALPGMLADQEFEEKATQRLSEKAVRSVPSPQSDVSAGL